MAILSLCASRSTFSAFSDLFIPPHSRRLLLLEHHVTYFHWLRRHLPWRLAEYNNAVHRSAEYSHDGFMHAHLRQGLHVGKALLLLLYLRWPHLLEHHVSYVHWLRRHHPCIFSAFSHWFSIYFYADIIYWSTVTLPSSGYCDIFVRRFEEYIFSIPLPAATLHLHRLHLFEYMFLISSGYGDIAERFDEYIFGIFSLLLHPHLRRLQFCWSTIT